MTRALMSMAPRYYRRIPTARQRLAVAQSFAQSLKRDHAMRVVANLPLPNPHLITGAEYRGKVRLVWQYAITRDMFALHADCFAEAVK